MSLPVKQKGKGFQRAESILALGFLAVILLGLPVEKQIYKKQIAK